MIAESTINIAKNMTCKKINASLHLKLTGLASKIMATKDRKFTRLRLKIMDQTPEIVKKSPKFQSPSETNWYRDDYFIFVNFINKITF
jgi:hypothetical protein